MYYIVKLFASSPNQICNYLNNFFKVKDIPKILEQDDILEWEADYSNPIDLVDLINYHQDEYESFDVELWICLDENLFIHVTKDVSDDIIRYIYERFPY